jgi:acyl dehydratase
MTTVFAKPEELFNAVGKNIDSSDWLTIDQDRIQKFADATGDHQWIHVDPEAAKDGPFGACIAHGFLTLSLVNHFLPQMMRVDGISMGVNVGCNRIRFPNAVKVGAKIRALGEVISVTEKKGGIESVVRVTVEIEGEEKPACIADSISRYFPES